jgi:hypothetical protein
MTGDELKTLHELEDLFVQKMLVVRTAYRIGIEEGINIHPQRLNNKKKRP